MSKSATWRRDVEDLARKYGCEFSETRGDHYKLTHASGWFVFVSRTPSDPRALRYVKSDLKRKAAGVWK